MVLEDKPHITEYISYINKKLILWPKFHRKTMKLTPYHQCF